MSVSSLGEPLLGRSRCRPEESGGLASTGLRVSILDIVLGRRLLNREYGTRKIGAFEGVPAMGLDGIGSSSYGPEAALAILIPLGAAGSAHLGWIMAPIVVLLLILFASYWQ